MKPTENDILAHLTATYGGKWEMLPVDDKTPLNRLFVDKVWHRSFPVRIDMVQKHKDKWKRWVDRQIAPIVSN